MYLVKTPSFIQSLFPGFIWKVPTEEKKLYLTFDDGPIPELTPWVLSLLNKNAAKATFFCVGDNVRKYPDILADIVSEGHGTGNHTHNHLSGWSADNIPYYQNIRRCASVVKSSLFRPPYGKLKPSQAFFLQRHYHIVMWDVLSGDFDEKLSNDQCFNNVINHVQNGSIIVFHDSLKSERKLKNTLSRILEYCTNEGFMFEPLTEELIGSFNKLRKSA
jgi:peptidoglycan/xylan/chitin deacetylase (PgdA/CDA1 family)